MDYIFLVCYDEIESLSLIPLIVMKTFEMRTGLLEFILIELSELSTSRNEYWTGAKNKHSDIGKWNIWNNTAPAQRTTSALGP